MNSLQLHDHTASLCTPSLGNEPSSFVLAPRAKLAAHNAVVLVTGTVFTKASRRASGDLVFALVLY